MFEHSKLYFRDKAFPRLNRDVNLYRTLLVFPSTPTPRMSRSDRPLFFSLCSAVCNQLQPTFVPQLVHTERLFTPPTSQVAARTEPSSNLVLIFHTTKLPTSSSHEHTSLLLCLQIARTELLISHLLACRPPPPPLPPPPTPLDRPSTPQASLQPQPQHHRHHHHRMGSAAAAPQAPRPPSRSAASASGSAAAMATAPGSAAAPPSHSHPPHGLSSSRWASNSGGANKSGGVSGGGGGAKAAKVPPRYCHFIRVMHNTSDFLILNFCPGLCSHAPMYILHTNMRTHTYTHAHTYTHTHTYVHTHTYIHRPNSAPRLRERPVAAAGKEGGQRPPFAMSSMSPYYGSSSNGSGSGRIGVGVGGVAINGSGSGRLGGGGSSGSLGTGGRGASSSYGSILAAAELSGLAEFSRQQQTGMSKVVVPPLHRAPSPSLMGSSSRINV